MSCPSCCGVGCGRQIGKTGHAAGQATQGTKIEDAAKSRWSRLRWRRWSLLLAWEMDSLIAHFTGGPSEHAARCRPSVALSPPIKAPNRIWNGRARGGKESLGATTRRTLPSGEANFSIELLGGEVVGGSKIKRMLSWTVLSPTTQGPNIFHVPGRPVRRLTHCPVTLPPSLPSAFTFSLSPFPFPWELQRGQRARNGAASALSHPLRGHKRTDDDGQCLNQTKCFPFRRRPLPRPSHPA